MESFINKAYNIIADTVLTVKFNVIMGFVNLLTGITPIGFWLNYVAVGFHFGIAFLFRYIKCKSCGAVLSGPELRDNTGLTCNKCYVNL